MRVEVLKGLVAKKVCKCMELRYCHCLNVLDINLERKRATVLAAVIEKNGNHRKMNIFCAWETDKNCYHQITETIIKWR